MERRDEKFSREVWDSCGLDGKEMPLQTVFEYLIMSVLAASIGSDIRVFRVSREKLRH